MATGYDCKFVDPTPDALVCLICTFVARDPQQTVCCGKVYCQDCLVGLSRYSNKCPHCREDLECFPDKRSDRDIKNLKVHCDNTSVGCQWTGELLTLAKHSCECPYSECPCPNKCKDDLKLLRKDIYKHLLECPKRQYKCPHCDVAGEYQEITTTHLEKCPKRKIECPNEGCSTVILFSELFDHRILCPYKQVHCRYAGIGCQIRATREDITEHENDAQLHLQLAVDTAARLQSVCSSLLSGYRMTDSSSAMFKFLKFEERKATESIIQSPPFYTSPGGYKLCIQVFANGNTIRGTGRGTHVAVFAYIMKGENDNQLTWPFTGIVKLELLNQLEDKDHYSKYYVDFSKNPQYGERVFDIEKADIGYGFSKYISHSSLGYDAEKNCQYLVDDCLYFRINTEVNNSAPKPWLSTCIANSF